jgi:hypothetical protein
VSFIKDVLGSTFVGDALTSGDAEKDAAKAQQQGYRSAIDEQRAARESFEQRVQPFTNIGLSAADPLMDLLGIGPYSQGGQPQQQAQNFSPQQQVLTPQALPATAEMTALQNQIAGLDSEIGQLSSTNARVSAGGSPMPRVPANLAGHMARAGRPASEIAATQSLISGGADVEGLASQRQDLQSQLDALTSANMTQAPSQQMPMEGEFIPSASGMTGGQDQLLQEINPLVSFLRQEGFEDIQESAAARGRLRSGGTLKDLTEFNTQLTSTIVPQLQEQKFNQLFNVLGLGQSSAVGQGQAALQTGSNIGNFQASIGQSRAGGILGAENARDQTRSDIAGLLGGIQGGAFTPPPQTFGGF